MSQNHYLPLLADLSVRLGANVQPGQVVEIGSEPGKEALAREIAARAYQRGAKFVDLFVFDPHFKRARALHAAPETLEYVPPWIGEQVLALGRARGAYVGLAGPVEPRLMDDIDPELLGKDMLPWVQEIIEVTNKRENNWTAAPCPTPGWAELVYPELDPAAALERLWDEIGHVCRLDEPDPVAAWEARLAQLTEVAGKLDAIELDELRFSGPGTDLRVGLLPTSRWETARMETVNGITHLANIPTEEVFTTPDPERTDGFVRSTKPLVTSEVTIEGLRVRFEGGRAVEISADRGAETLRALSARDPGGAQLGEIALVDHQGRIGPLGTVFFHTLLDENAASHIALGAGINSAVKAEEDRARVNRSQIHIDFMIGSDEVSVTGLTRAGDEVALLREGSCQI